MGASSYELVVRGRLTARQAEALAPLTPTTTVDGDTLLTGPVRDQAELNGILHRLAAHRLVLVALRPVSSEADFPARYELVVSSGLSAPLREAFGGATVRAGPDGTRVIASVSDGDGLNRILDRIEALGLRLVSVTRLS